MCCIHFSNKKRKEVAGGLELVWCEGGICPLSSPTLRPVRQARPSSTPSDTQQLIVHQRPVYYLLILKDFLEDVCRDEDGQQGNNCCIEIEYRRTANMLEICHLYHNRNGVGSRGRMKKCSLQPATPGESGRFHLQGARLRWHEIFLHISKSVIVFRSGLCNILPHI